MNLFQKLRTVFGAPDPGVPLTSTQGSGYHPRIVRRPVIGVGNAPQWTPEAQMLSFNAVSGGGTITGNPPAAISGPMLDFAPNKVGAPIQHGTFVQSRDYTGLLPQSFMMPGKR